MSEQERIDNPDGGVAITITAECITCGHIWKMSAEDIKLAKEMGCASCEKCAGPATVKDAAVG